MSVCTASLGDRNIASDTNSFIIRTANGGPGDLRGNLSARLNNCSCGTTSLMRLMRKASGASKLRL